VNDVLKQRLVGALVLIALGVIFWPIIFVEPGMEPMLLSSQVPEAPPTADFELPAPRPSENVRQAGAALEGAEVEPLANVVVPIVKISTKSKSLNTPKVKTIATQEKSTNDQRPVLDGRGIPIAWSLRVASFSQRDRADRLQQKLIKMGYKASSKVIRSGSVRMIRVSVGPKFEKQTLLQAKSIIDKKFKVISLIARYVP
jgi:DedD protein